MSGGGGGGGWDPPREVSCDSLIEETPINSPVPAVISTLSVGDVLQVDRQPAGATFIIVVKKAGAIAGSITSTLVARIAQCIQKGHSYEAEVMSITGALVTVRIRHT